MRGISSLVLLTLCLQVFAQDPLAFDVFHHDGVCELRLHYDEKLLRQNTADETYQDALLEWVKAPGDTMRVEIEIKARGNMRKDYCSLPPLMLRFPKKDFDDRKLKLVRPCRDAPQYENYIMAEYGAYRMYNVVTDSSFRVQLVKMTYLDSSNKLDLFSHYAFLIEHPDQLADRMGGVIHNNTYIRESMLNNNQMNVLNFFQYMIGNTDWGVKNKHNLEMVVDTSTLQLTPIAYDFDYSGFVQTPYAVPQEHVPIAHITVRYNIGYCMENEEAELLRTRFSGYEEEIMAICETLPNLEPKYRKHRVKYMKQYFKWLQKPSQVRYVFTNKCKQMFK